jgi:hypothetical protein
MPMEIMSEEAALAIWARAAQLQDEASPSALVRSDAPHGATSLVLDADTRAPSGMYLADEVMQAALEAGIAAEFVAIAMAEHDALGSDATRISEELAPADRAQIIGQTATSLRVSRVIPEGADVVLDRLRTMAGQAPYHLAFDAALGPHPLQGGVLRFSVPGLGVANAETGERGAFNGFLYQAARMSVTDVHVTLTPRGTTEAPGCEVSVTVDLRRGQRFNTRFFSGASMLLAAMFGGSGVLMGGLVGAKLLGGAIGLLGGAVVGATAGVASAVAYNALVAAISRWEHRVAHRAITDALENLLRRVQRPGDADRVFGSAGVVRPRLQRRHDTDAEMRLLHALYPGAAVPVSSQAVPAI